MDKLEIQIYNAIIANPGIKGSGIAKKIGEDTTIVNRKLAQSDFLRNKFKKDPVTGEWFCADTISDIADMDSQPRSTLLIVSVEGSPDPYIVVEASAEQNSDEKIFWIGRKTSQNIISALILGRTSFEDRGREVRIVDYKKSRRFEDHYLRFLRAQREKQTVYVYKSAHYEEECIQETALFLCPLDWQIRFMDVFYHPKKKQYFINYETYEAFRQKYGLPQIVLTMAPGENSRSFRGWNEKSDLYLYGYSVGADAGLTTEQRWMILRNLMDSKLKQKGDIIRHLEMLIEINKDRPQLSDACSKWREDLRFVNQYKCQFNHMFWASDFLAK